MNYKNKRHNNWEDDLSERRFNGELGYYETEELYYHQHPKKNRDERLDSLAFTSARERSFTSRNINTPTSSQQRDTPIPCQVDSQYERPRMMNFNSSNIFTDVELTDETDFKEFATANCTNTTTTQIGFDFSMQLRKNCVNTNEFVSKLILKIFALEKEMEKLKKKIRIQNNQTLENTNVKEVAVNLSAKNITNSNWSIKACRIFRPVHLNKLFADFILQNRGYQNENSESAIKRFMACFILALIPLTMRNEYTARVYDRKNKLRQIPDHIIGEITDFCIALLNLQSKEEIESWILKIGVIIQDTLAEYRRAVCRFRAGAIHTAAGQITNYEEKKELYKFFKIDLPTEEEETIESIFHV